ncbi:ABC transporter substrate-binding protein [Mesorhizobium sp. M5C.F.Ca.IN.020.29.1.1]|uniref:ABC transporter substrate-binding protein n=1 Tax=unclassified Mesorhizobium TaxID=325217 RepID=UPI000FC9F3CC|nr:MULTISPECIES: ABC transporter substrate-binding protein [unclassified Mesorhizobium]RUV54911.1 ABC transporter substrate-binding protein [Mesorhizobium sp. M5C.F.Ca.IN.020.29.1.1]TIM86615.1 MAG: twin-arginine translocation signal domain-containing protein [Mesorhizobium sp.]
MTEFETKLKLAAKLAAKGRVSRRDFVQLALAAGLTATAANAMFVQTVRAEPKKGGTLKIGIGDAAATDSLDPGSTNVNRFTGTALFGTLSNGLTEIDSKGNVVPDLAESFEPSDGAKKWVSKLRKGATFHNGKTVTADDVVASVRHHNVEGTKSVMKSLLASVKNVVADGAETVVFELDGGNADFPYIMSDIPVMPAKEGGVDWESGIRTGPYMLETFEPGVIATFNKNPNYFKSDKGWFDRVECLAINDVTARTNALYTGEVHYMDRCHLKTLDILKQNPDLVISETTGYGHYVYVMNVQKAPFDNPDVRNAIKYSLNRDEIVQKVFLGHGAVGNDNPIAPTVKFAIDPQPKHVYDTDMVKSLLKKAGAENTQFDLSVADAGFTGATDSALLWQEHARAAGLNLNVIREPNEGYWDNVWLKKPFYASYWAGRPTCDWMFTTAYAAEAVWNETFWKNPRFNELLVAARSETDDTKRAGMYAEMQQLLHDDGGLVNLVFNSYVDAHTTALAHGEVASNWPMDGQKIAERWWFA